MNRLDKFLTKLIVFGFISFVIFGCGTTPVNNNANNVKLMKGDPPDNCKEIGVASASAYGPDFETSMRNKLKNKGADMGGNYIRMESVDAVGNNLTGTVFSCPMIP